MTATTTTPASPQTLATTLLTHTPAPHTFTFTPFLQLTHHHSLSSRPLCKSFSTTGTCPLKTQCPDRHTPSTTTSHHSGGFGSLVCKHWLRGLCKKGESCEFLHEYNLRKMPECNFFVRNGYCSNGDECLYLHIDPQSRLPPCPHYERGFCPLGPVCDKRHVRRRVCEFYLAGFCPDGRGCKGGAHPKWRREGELEEPKVREERKVEEQVGRGEEGFGGHGEGGRDGFGGDREGRGRDGGERGHGHKERFGGGRGGRWRGRGGGKFRGRGGH